MASTSTKEMERLFRKSRKTNSDYILHDSAEFEICLSYDCVLDEVCVESHTGNIYELGVLSKNEIQKFTMLLERTDQYDFKELYVVKEKLYYDDDSHNGLFEVRLYHCRNSNLHMFGKPITVSSTDDDTIFIEMFDNGYYIHNVKLTTI